MSNVSNPLYEYYLKVLFTSVLTTVTRCKDKSFDAFETSSGYYATSSLCTVCETIKTEIMLCDFTR